MTDQTIETVVNEHDRARAIWAYTRKLMDRRDSKGYLSAVDRLDLAACMVALEQHFTALGNIAVLPAEPCDEPQNTTP